jgi:predicted Mrr-cat superfamily restriction endonuclease
MRNRWLWIVTLASVGLAAAQETASQPAVTAASNAEKLVEIEARIAELKRRRVEVVQQYNAAYELQEKNRLAAEIRRIEGLLSQSLGEQAYLAEAAAAAAAGASATPALGSREREAEIVARLAEYRGKRRELVQSYNRTYKLTDKKALDAEIERIEKLIQRAEGELELSKQAAEAHSP